MLDASALAVLQKAKNKIIESLTDLYIIALGTNDIRYRDSSICAMNSSEYIYQIDKIHPNMVLNYFL